MITPPRDRSKIAAALRAAASLLHADPELFVIEAITEIAPDSAHGQLGTLIFNPSNARVGWGDHEHRLVYLLLLADAVEAGAL